MSAPAPVTLIGLGPMGQAMVRALLAVPDVRVVYKPHPRVLDSTDPAIVAAHAEVTALMKGEHVALPEADILAVMPDCHAMVTDVSSVGLDWLYLRTDARGRGIGRSLMESLIGQARSRGVHTLIGRLSADNDASLRLHAGLGFVEVGRLREVGRKFDRWLTLVFVQKIL